MPTELEITRSPEISGEDLRKLSEESVAFYLALGSSPGQIALIYGVGTEKVERLVRRVERRQAEEADRRERMLRRAATGRPMPPEALGDPQNPVPLFAPDANLAEWVRETFLAEEGPLHNPDHLHLLLADVAFLWTNVANARGGRRIVGQAERPSAQGGKWAKARAEFQIVQWFGSVPTFLITLDARYAVEVDDASWCGLVEHELYHCGQAVDEFGGLKFTKEDLPVFALCGHSAEEHVGVVARYGVGAASGGVAELVAAAARPPSVAPARIAAACGTCLR